MSMSDYDKLILQNKAWSHEMKDQDPEFFDRLSSQQTPKFLWIGCSDSRVPSNQITGTQPGEIFVQRNIANLVVPTDLNLLSVLQYAVDVLKVEHIIVCGHYGCGGIKAAMTSNTFGLLDRWLRRIKEIYRNHQDELMSLPEGEARENRLVELNVVEQCHELTRISTLQKAWDTRQAPQIHGWVYGLNDGLIKELISIDPGSHQIDPIFQFSSHP